MLAFAAPGIYGHCAGRKSHLCHVCEQRVRTRGVERPIQLPVELLLDQIVCVLDLHPGSSVAHTPAENIASHPDHQMTAGPGEAMAANQELTNRTPRTFRDR